MKFLHDELNVDFVVYFMKRSATGLGNKHLYCVSRLLSTLKKYPSTCFVSMQCNRNAVMQCKLRIKKM